MEKILPSKNNKNQKKKTIEGSRPRISLALGKRAKREGHNNLKTRISLALGKRAKKKGRVFDVSQTSSGHIEIPKKRILILNYEFPPLEVLR